MWVTPYLLAQFGNSLLDGDQVHRLSVAHNRGDKTLLGCDGDADINVVPIDDRITTVGALNRSVDNGEVTDGEDNGTGEGAHEAKLNARLLEHLILILVAELDQSRHVDLVEGRQGRGGVLRLLETLGNAETHPVHLDLHTTSQIKHILSKV